MDLRDLYQSTILDHNKSPRNFGRPGSANRQARGDNPLCGDKITVYLDVDDGVVADVGLEGTGCAISTASASMMTEAVKGKPLAEVFALFETFHELLAGEQGGTPEDIGKLAVFSGVREYPMRVKCATLAWHTLRAAAQNETQPVKTE